MAAGVLDLIAEGWRAGSSVEARENSAATFFSLSVLDEYNIDIGSQPVAIPALVEPLCDGFPRGKKDGVTTLFNISVFHGNKARVVAARAVPFSVSLLTDESTGITDDALAVLALVTGSPQGLAAVIGETNIIPILVNLLQSGSPKNKENSISVLLPLCRSGDEHIISSVLKIRSAIPSL